jgi:hypothetical protein
MIILHTAILLGKDQSLGTPPGDNKRTDSPGSNTTPSTSPSQEPLDDLSVNGLGSKDSQRRDLVNRVDLRQVTKLVSPDGALRTFLKRFAGMMLRDADKRVSYRTGQEAQLDPKRDHVYAKRNEGGELILKLVGDPEKLRNRRLGFAIVDPSRTQILSEGVISGDTITFPRSQGIPGNAHIVLTEQGVIGSSLSSLERRISGSRVVESLLGRCKSSTVSDALQAGQQVEEQEKAKQDTEKHP